MARYADVCWERFDGQAWDYLREATLPIDYSSGLVSQVEVVVWNRHLKSGS